MILPHQAPIRFAQNIIELNDDFALVRCEFPCIPTLSMVSESAAQSSAAFAQNSEKPIIGFLISLKGIQQVGEFLYTEYLIKIKKEITFGSMTEFSFELISNSTIFAKGSLTIALQNDSI